ncbi:zinc finger CCCH domain-containing protein 48-like isoform X2 [Silene latifolia]
MTEVISRRVAEGRGRVPYSWHRAQPAAANDSGIVCKYWLRGHCTRNPCRFRHPNEEAPKNCSVQLNSLKAKQSHIPLQPLRVVTKRANGEQNAPNVKRRTSPKNALDNKGYQCGTTKKPIVEEKVVESVKHRDVVDQKPTAVHTDDLPEKLHKICVDWINKTCVHDEKCKYMHSWSSSNDFSKMVQLEGHKKAVTGINLLSGSDKLFTSSEDGTVRMWNCHTGEFIASDVGSPVWCLASEGPWVFAGITNAIKAWNIEAQLELTLNAPSGHVYALTMVDGVLYCGLQVGSILVWKLNSEGVSFEGPMLVKGHTGAVVSLFRGGHWLFSASVDKTVRVWDFKNMVCSHTLQKHSEEVMSVLCWEQYLLSCSLDKTLKVWGRTEAGDFEVVHTHIEDNGILSLCGMHDAAGNPILLCSCNDNSVRLYDLPSFVERGRIYANEEVKTIHIGPGGHFFTGDAAGTVSVWRCSGDFSGSPDKVAAA